LKSAGARRAVSLLDILTYDDAADMSELSLILSNRIDTRGDAGGLISVNAFGKLAKDIIKWRKKKNAVQP